MKTGNTQRWQGSRRDVYEEVTKYVVEALERGEILWQKPWNSYGLPKNITSGKHYRGWNIFFLNFVCLLKNYRKPYFLTFLQAKELGGRIRKGEHGYNIIYWAAIEDKYHSITVKSEITGDEKTVHPFKRVPKLHTVFNITQTEGIEFPTTENVERSLTEKIQACEEIITGMPQRPAIIHGGERACYIPVLDEVRMPAQSLFHSDEEYYCALFHELGHSTGHASRLNREELKDFSVFGDSTYSKEELTAELTASYLSGISGIGQKTIDNSAAYIRGWLHKLRDDKRFFLRAATQAQAAADFILNIETTSTTIHQPMEIAA